jgi:predicted TIM-barrel fold metal-dependent hydrolase
MAEIELDAVIAQLPLVDHHVHGALAADVDLAAFEGLITESHTPVPEGVSGFDSQIGFAIRRWCAPVLDLDPFASAADYLARRREIGNDQVNRRFLHASGVSDWLVETGHRADLVLGVDGMAAASGGKAHEVVRLESVAEDLALEEASAGSFATRYREALDARTREAVAVKSIVAYRFGLDFDPRRPSAAEVERAASAWLAAVSATGRARITDPVLLRYLIWTGIDRGLPLQIHTGYGDPDLELHRSDPLLLTQFLKLVEGAGLPVMLLHCYPFHRGAGYLAQVFPQVYMDVGLAINYTGTRATSVVAESLELAPFAKVLFSSDAWGPAELHYLGALLWRRALTAVLGRWVASGDWSAADALRVADMIGGSNARRAYRLP